MNRKHRQTFVSLFRMVKAYAEQAEDISRVLPTSETNERPNSAEITALTEVRARAVHMAEGLMKLIESIEMYIGAHQLLEQIDNMKEGKPSGDKDDCSCVSCTLRRALEQKAKTTQQKDPNLS